MKRDIDLVRKILIACEEHPSGFAPYNMKVEGYTASQIGYHIHLMVEAGLLHGDSVTTTESDSPVGIASGITWEGYEFLDAARSETVWAKVKIAASGLPLKVLMPLLTSYLINEGKRILKLPQ
jgi:hypothetical protein